MKQIAKIAAIAVFGAMAMTSCKKDYTCKCTYTVNGVSSSTSVALGKQKKKDAEAACSAKSVTTAGITYACGLE
jgi:hypothetical protein